MKRISVLTAAAVAMAVGAAPASASLPVVGQSTGSDITQGADTAVGGAAGAIGGNGGKASTGNTQVLNGNSAAVTLIGPAKSKGGHTSAKSGDAYGGNGGDAKARGGDADASDGVRSGKSRSHVEQGDDVAVGGNGHAKGGDGGDADTGNKQFGNGNSLAVSPGGKPERSSHGKGSRHESETRSEGGDTHAKSGDAYGGNGGDAKARGGDADASDRVEARERGCGRGRGKREEKGSWLEQGDDRAFGGPAYAEGGDGGDADTGNTQFLNGNSLAFSVFGGAGSEGGDTSAKSGDAYGGNGGDAKARGGDADASDVS